MPKSLMSWVKFGLAVLVIIWVASYFGLPMPRRSA